MGHYRIKSNGTVHGTTVYDPEGNKVQLIRSVTVNFKPGDYVTAIIEVIQVDLDLLVPEENVTIIETTEIEVE